MTADEETVALWKSVCEEIRYRPDPYDLFDGPRCPNVGDCDDDEAFIHLLLLASTR
jgi:hypothetical protein